MKKTGVLCNSKKMNKHVKLFFSALTRIVLPPFFLLLPSSVFAQPHQNTSETNRAIVKEFTAELELPNGDPLFVGMKMNCNSRFAEAGMIVFSDQQVETLARAYEILYGQQVADDLRQAWSSKQTPESPRLPTFVIVLDNPNQKSEQFNSNSTHLDGLDSNEESRFQHQYQNNQQPLFFLECGGMEHPPE